MPQSVVKIASWGAVRYEDFTLHNGGAAQWASSPRKPPINQLSGQLVKLVIMGCFTHWIQLWSPQRRPIYRLTGKCYNALCWVCRGRGFCPLCNPTQPCVGSRIRTTVAVRLPPVGRPRDELVLPSPGCPRLQRYRRLVPDSGGIDHESSFPLHLQLVWWFSGVAAPFVGIRGGLRAPGSATGPESAAETAAANPR